MPRRCLGDPQQRRVGACGALQFSPPFITTEAQITEFAEAVAALA